MNPVKRAKQERLAVWGKHSKLEKRADPAKRVKPEKQFGPAEKRSLASRFPPANPVRNGTRKNPEKPAAQTKLEGRVWVLTDSTGRLIEDIDTDQIYHNAFLHITDIAEMGQYALGNLEGWKDFAKKAGPGDIVIAGRNFGAGSSRQQAVDCFLSLGVALIIAPSFGAIYFRNAVNSALPVLKCPALGDLTAQKKIRTGDRISLGFKTGEARNLTQEVSFSVDPMSEVQLQIHEAGGLFPYARQTGA